MNITEALKGQTCEWKLWIHYRLTGDVMGSITSYWKSGVTGETREYMDGVAIADCPTFFLDKELTIPLPEGRHA